MNVNLETSGLPHHIQQSIALDALGIAQPSTVPSTIHFHNPAQPDQHLTQRSLTSRYLPIPKPDLHKSQDHADRARPPCIRRCALRDIGPKSRTARKFAIRLTVSDRLIVLMDTAINDLHAEVWPFPPTHHTHCVSLHADCRSEGLFARRLSWDFFSSVVRVEKNLRCTTRL
jgi:hypothetical protein